MPLPGPSVGSLLPPAPPPSTLHSRQRVTWPPGCPKPKAPAARCCSELCLASAPTLPPPRAFLLALAPDRTCLSFGQLPGPPPCLSWSWQSCFVLVTHIVLSATLDGQSQSHLHGHRLLLAKPSVFWLHEPRVGARQGCLERGAPKVSPGLQMGVEDEQLALSLLGPAPSTVTWGGRDPISPPRTPPAP